MMTPSVTPLEGRLPGPVRRHVRRRRAGGGVRGVGEVELQPGAHARLQGAPPPHVIITTRTAHSKALIVRGTGCKAMHHDNAAAGPPPACRAAARSVACGQGRDVPFTRARTLEAYKHSVGWKAVTAAPLEN
jgi:hypothetical protein